MKTIVTLILAVLILSPVVSNADVPASRSGGVGNTIAVKKCSEKAHKSQTKAKKKVLVSRSGGAASTIAH